MKKSLTTLFALLFLIFPFGAGAQNDNNSGYQPKMLVYENLLNDTVLSHFRERFAVMERLVENPSDVAWTNELVLHDFDPGQLPSDSLYLAKSAYETLALNRNKGFEVTGQVYGRLDHRWTNFLNADDDDAVSVYHAKVQGEIGWNWINSSLYQRRYKERAILLDNQIEQARQFASDEGVAYDAWTDTLTQRWNHILATVMLCHVNNIDAINEAYQMMIENDRITSGQLLDVMNDKMELEFELAQIYAKDKVIPQEQLPLIEPQTLLIDTLTLRREIAANNPKNRYNELKIEKLDNDSRMTNYLSTMRLTPFARWSTYLTSQDKLSHNADIGVRFTIPLYNQSKRKKQAMEVEKEILQLENSDYTDDMMTQCLLSVDRVQRLNQSIAVEYNHLKQLRKYLEIRRKAYSANKGRYSYIDRMLEYNEYCKSMERLYKQMRDRSLALVTLQKATNLKTLANVVRIVQTK